MWRTIKVRRQLASLELSGTQQSMTFKEIQAVVPSDMTLQSLLSKPARQKGTEAKLPLHNF